MRGTNKTRTVFFKPQEVIELKEICTSCIYISFENSQIRKLAWAKTVNDEWLALAPSDILTKRFREEAKHTISNTKTIYPIPSTFSRKQRMILRKAEYKGGKNGKNGR